jgi:hypothetical protein
MTKAAEYPFYYMTPSEEMLLEALLYAAKGMEDGAADIRRKVAEYRMGSRKNLNTMRRDAFDLLRCVLHDVLWLTPNLGLDSRCMSLAEKATLELVDHVETPIPAPEEIINDPIPEATD